MRKICLTGLICPTGGLAQSGSSAALPVLIDDFRLPALFQSAIHNRKSAMLAGYQLVEFSGWYDVHRGVTLYTSMSNILGEHLPGSFRTRLCCLRSGRASGSRWARDRKAEGSKQKLENQKSETRSWLVQTILFGSATAPSRRRAEGKGQKPKGKRGSSPRL
jgi:hypothetical protein